jgi:hypothetical protein
MVTPNKDSIEARIEALLAQHADTLIDDDSFDMLPFESSFTDADFAPVDVAEVRNLMQLATQVSTVLSPIEPSPEYIARLRAELAGQAQTTLLVRWRKLPASYQLAAKLGGMAITAGIVALAAARGLNALTHRDDNNAEAGLSPIR